MTTIMLKRALSVLLGVYAVAAFSSPNRLRTPSSSYRSNSKSLAVVPNHFQITSPSPLFYHSKPASTPRHQLHYQRTTTSTTTTRLDSTSSLSLSEDAFKYDDTTPETSTSQTLTQATFSLIKAMVGSGLLALPAGLAAATNAPSALVPANLLLIFLGVASGYTFSLYGRLTHATQSTGGMGDLWHTIMDTDKEHVDTSAIVSWANLIYCFGVAVFFSSVSGDAFAQLLQSTGQFPAWVATRQTCILTVTLTVLVRLCNLSSLARLAPVSILGVLGTVFTTAFLGWRCPAICASSPYAMPHGGFLAAAAAARPTFSTYSRLHTPAPLLLFAMSCVALMAHFSAGDLYRSLKPSGSKSRTINNSNLPAEADATAMRKFNLMTIMGYVAVMVLNALAMTFGFLTFGGNCEGVVLNNYSTRDLGASLSRLFIAVSVIGTYPFIISACRSSYLELFGNNKLQQHQNTGAKRAQSSRITNMLLALATGIALVAKDVGFVVGFNGALMGSTIIYTFPALLFLKWSKTRTALGEKMHRWIGLERWLCRFLVLFGMGAAIVGSGVSVISSFYPHLLR